LPWSLTEDPTILPALYSRAAGQEGAGPKPGAVGAGRLVLRRIIVTTARQAIKRACVMCVRKPLFLCTLSVILTRYQVLIAKQSVTTVSAVACKRNYCCLNRTGF